MHGLIFETSVCYWQNQPGYYLYNMLIHLQWSRQHTRSAPLAPCVSHHTSKWSNNSITIDLPLALSVSFHANGAYTAAVSCFKFQYTHRTKLRLPTIDMRTCLSTLPSTILSHNENGNSTMHYSADQLTKKQVIGLMPICEFFLDRLDTAAKPVLIRKGEIRYYARCSLRVRMLLSIRRYYVQPLLHRSAMTWTFIFRLDRTTIISGQLQLFVVA
jgi:hypothetical protein